MRRVWDGKADNLDLWNLPNQSRNAVNFDAICHEMNMIVWCHNQRWTATHCWLDMWHPNVNSVPHQSYWGNTRSIHGHPPACLFGTTTAFKLNLDSFLKVKTGKFRLIDRSIPLVGIIQAVHTDFQMLLVHAPSTLDKYLAWNNENNKGHICFLNEKVLSQYLYSL